MAVVGSFVRYLRSLDAFGQDIKVNYKGQEWYNTSAGGVLNILVKSLTLIMMVSAISELIHMRRPTITEFDRDLSQDEMRDLFEFNATDYGFVLIFAVSVHDKTTG